MKRLAIFVLALVGVFSASMAFAEKAQPILPKDFGGWQQSNAKASSDPAVADATNAAILKEYGFKDFESADYTKPGRKMTVKAARFADATGAYGAFTFYKLPEMLNEKFGDQGASLNERILFYRGNVLVQATLDRVTAMSAAELRELSKDIPLPGGAARNLPTLPQYLPKHAYVKSSARYVLGPLALNAVGAPLSADQIDFSRDPEIAEGKYATSRGTATLLLIAYPTPQIAAERTRYFESLTQNSTPQQDASLASPFTTKRSGHIIALVAGQISPDEAKSLLASINYEADVTWSQDTTFVNRVSTLLINGLLLSLIIGGLALVAGIAFGGVRILAERFFPGRVFDRPEDVEIIRLNLRK
jgi:hypothetical protein